MFVSVLTFVVSLLWSCCFCRVVAFVVSLLLSLLWSSIDRCVVSVVGCFVKESLCVSSCGMLASLVGVGGFILKPGEEPPQAYCRQEGHPVVPDVFHKLWSGVRCPPVQDLVSLLSTVLLLRPARVVYTTTYDSWLCWQVQHQEPMGLYIALHAHKKKRWFDVQSCHRRLGVERRIINTRDNQTAFANATREFAAARPNPPTKQPRSSNTAEAGVGKTSAVQMTDILRAYVMLNEGGFYLDGDMFVLSGGEYQTWRRCPTVVGTSRGTWFPPVRANDSETLNTAAMCRTDL